MKTLILRSKYT